MALFHTVTPNKQSSANATTLVQPLPLPYLQCWTLVPAVSPELKNCIRLGEGELQRILKDNSAFSNFSCKTLIIRGITSQSQGLLTTIVGKMNTLNPVRLVRKSNFIIFFLFKGVSTAPLFKLVKGKCFFLS